MGFKFNPTTGQLDISGGSGSAAPVVMNQVKDSRIAGENGSALKLVYSDFTGEVFVASNTGSYDEARVLGVALTAFTSGNNVEILTYGFLMDLSFNFTANDELYLDSLGNISTTVPLTGHRVPVGYALSATEIFIDIREIVIL